MVRNSTLNNALSNSQNQTFKSVNNLLTLQENHVEEFFQYHGMEFLTALEKLVEDVVQRVVSQMLAKLEFSIDNTSNQILLKPDSLREYERITQENIELDIQMLLSTAVNSEVIQQRKLSKQHYIESQGFSPQTTPEYASQAPMGVQPAGGTTGVQGGFNAAYQAQQSGYPVAPAGSDAMGQPYWLDPQTGQMTYDMPGQGLGLISTGKKVATWAKWLM
jgi:hypothetical protein